MILSVSSVKTALTERYRAPETAAMRAGEGLAIHNLIPIVEVTVKVSYITLGTVTAKLLTYD